MRRIYYILVCFIACFLFSISVDAKESNIYIADEAGLLSEDEINDLEEYFETLNSDFNYVAVTVDHHEHYGIDSDEVLEDYYNTYYDDTQSGLAFIIDMYSRRIILSAYGDLRFVLRASDEQDVTDNVYKYASKEDYYDCIYHAFSQAYTICNDGFVLRPMRIIVTVLISLILGFMIPFLRAMKQRNRLRISKEEREIVMAGAGVVAAAQVYDSVKRHIDRAISSSGHSSSGGSYHHSSYSGGSSHSSHSGGGFSSHSSGGHSSGGHSF